MKCKYLVFCCFLCCAVFIVAVLPFRLIAQTSTSSVITESKGEVSISDFGGKGDGVSDVTSAFNSAIAAATPKSLTVYFPCGSYRFASRPNPIESGVRLRGCGSVGSTPGYGSSLIANYDERSPEEPFLVWTGAYKKGGTGCCAGTGGGIENLALFKGAGKKGGTAIKFTGIDDGHRAGYSTISDVLVGSVGGGTWEHNLIIDGSCCTTPHGQGVRDTYINNFWAAQASSAGQSILLRSAVQVFWHGGEVMPARAGSNTGITITGGNQITRQSVNIFISDVYIVGSLAISNARSISFRGLVGGDATIEPSASNVVLGGLVAGKIVNRSASATIKTNKLISLPQAGQLMTRALQTGTTEAVDLAGTCTAAAHSCSYTFTGTYTSHPICTASNETTGTSDVKVTYNGVTSVTFTTPGATDVINFICIGRN